jgi:hypothetical protein
MNAATDRFCTSCGALLAEAGDVGGRDEQTVALTPPPAAPLPLSWAEPQSGTDGGVTSAEQGAVPLRTGRRSRRVWLLRGLAALLIAAGLAGTLVFYVLWDSELTRALGFAGLGT